MSVSFPEPAVMFPVNNKNKYTRKNTKEPKGIQGIPLMKMIEEVFLEFCGARPDGVTDRQFREAHPEYTAVDLVNAINVLSAKGQVELFKKGTQLHYRAVAAEDVQIIGNLEGDEKIVYQCIKAADNKGIWTKDLKLRTNLHQTVITKVLKSLEGRKIIKAVKSVKVSILSMFVWVL